MSSGHRSADDARISFTSDGGDHQKNPFHSPRITNLATLAIVELQLCLQFLCTRDIQRAARCSHFLRNAASHPFAWRFAGPAVCVNIATQANIDRLIAETSGPVTQNVPLNVNLFASRLNLSTLVQRCVKQLDMLYASMPDAGQIASIRQMQWLVRIEWTSREDQMILARLLQPGHRLQHVEFIRMENAVLDRTLVDLLVELPELAYLYPRKIDMSCWDRICEMSKLRIIHCCNDEQQPLSASLQSLLSVSPVLPMLHILRVGGRDSVSRLQHQRLSELLRSRSKP